MSHQNSYNTPSLSFYERLGAWLIVSFFAFLTLFNVYLGEETLPKETGSVHRLENLFVSVIIKGAVKYPGEYQVYKGTSVKEALALAHPLKTADLKRIKLESKVLRRRVLHVKEK